jgi:hypothetical protein
VSDKLNLDIFWFKDDPPSPTLRRDKKPPKTAPIWLDLGLSQSARHCAGQHNDRPEGGEHDNSESNQLG